MISFDNDYTYSSSLIQTCRRMSKFIMVKASNVAQCIKESLPVTTSMYANEDIRSIFQSILIVTIFFTINSIS